MMSESVTVQDSRTGAPGKSEPGQTSLVGGLNLNAGYFRTVPGIIKIVQLLCPNNGDSESFIDKWHMGYSPETGGAIKKTISVTKNMIATKNKARKPILNRSAISANIENIDVVKLSRDIQQRLGCAVNENVFLECPYAFVNRQELLELSQETNSPLEHLSGKLVSFTFTKVLMGYIGNKVSAEESAEFVISLTEETTKFLINHNRWITKTLLNRVQDEIRKNARPWQDHGTMEELNETFLRKLRPLHEIVVSLPVGELCHKRHLGNRSPEAVRDGYVELLPTYETFVNRLFKTISQSCQTNLYSQNQEVQTFPGHPKNQWTQYEFEIPKEILEVWQPDENTREVEECMKENSEEYSSKNEEAKEIDELQLVHQEYKRKAKKTLNLFLKNHANEMIDAISFNASINLYINDIENLNKTENIEVFSESYKDYKECMSLVDLKTVENKYLTNASWHSELENVIACSYLDQDAKNCSLVVLWSLLSPLRPKIILNCEEKLSIISFCPQRSYTNIIVGGCLDGKVIIWELDGQILEVISNNQDDSYMKNIYEDPLTKQAKVAISTEIYQSQSITNIQWLPPWCRLEKDGNFQLNTDHSPREQKSYFATSSIEGTIFFWSLPKSLSVPVKIRSPLHVQISPFYQLIIKEPGEKSSTRIPITCFSLPLAKNEESSNINVREKSNLERLRKIFIGTTLGEVLCCSWESQTFSVNVTDSEVCKIITRCCIHDGIVRTMVKSPDLDDVFLTVGGRVFALWKEDFIEEPIFRRSSYYKYGEGCWSGRSGMFALARLDGCIELWDLKKKSDEAVLLQVVSGKITPYVYPNPPTFHNKLLAVSDGSSILRIFVEPLENCKAEDLDRIEWFEEFAWRETKRKIDFRRWQNDYLREHPTALRRKAEREQVEANRRHQEARERFLKKQEILARKETERQLAKRRTSKSILLQQNEKKRAEIIILRKKGFEPSQLEEKRKPLIVLEEERIVKSQKIKEELYRADQILKKCLMQEIPEVQSDKSKNESMDKNVNSYFVEKTRLEYEADYELLKKELANSIMERPYVPEFCWGQTIKAGKKRMNIIKKR